LIAEAVVLADNLTCDASLIEGLSEMGREVEGRNLIEVKMNSLLVEQNGIRPDSAEYQVVGGISNAQKSKCENEN
jgi:hypothetical protein